MKKLIIVSWLALLFSVSIQAQTDTLKIKTSSVCENCKRTIENDLSFEKGVKAATLDLDSNLITVVYNPKKTTPEKIRQRISDIGYDADDVKRNPKAFNKLPDCCKSPDGHH